jgi:hypothetical protein
MMADIFSFLHFEGNFKDSIIDEGQHDQEVNAYVPDSIDQTLEKNKVNPINNIPKSVVKLEKL